MLISNLPDKYWGSTSACQCQHPTHTNAHHHPASSCKWQHPADANTLPPPPCVIQENNEEHQTDSQQQKIIDMVEAAQGLPCMDEGRISSHFRFNIPETYFILAIS